MGLKEWITRITRAVDAEYDRRIKRASNVVTYGAHHGDEHEEEEEAVIVNVPRGAPVHTLSNENGTHITDTCL